MLKFAFLCVCATFAFAASSVFAQDDPSETVIVTATRVPTPEIEIASSVTVLTADLIAARQLSSLPDILANVPGLDVVQTGGEGGQTSIFMRGTDSNHTKVLIDGIDMSDPSNPNDSVDPGKILSGDIARVEVLRGPQSGLYGSDAIGGVINVISKSGDGPAAFSVTAEGGTFGTFNETGSVSGSEGDFHYAATVQHLHAGATPVTPLDLLPAGEARNDDLFDNVSASTKLGYNVTGNFDLGLVARYTDSRSHITGDTTDPVTFASFPSPTQTDIDTLQYETRGTAHLVLDGIDQTLGLSYASSVTADLDPNNGSFPSVGDRIKLDWQGNVGLMDGEILVLGAEDSRDAIHVPLSAGISTAAGFAELQSSMGGDFFDTVSLRYDSNSRFGDRMTWRVAAAYVIAATGTKLKASIGTGFKAPSLEQLFESFPAFGFFANPDLKPETSIGYDAGIEQSLFDGKVRMGATLFRNDITNLIVSNGSFVHGMDINIGRARTQGLESFVAWQALDKLNLRADYTYTDALDVVSHQELLRRPRNKLSVTADWQALDALSLDAGVLYTGPEIDASRDFSVPRLRNPGYATVNLAANYAVDGTWTLFARIDNLLDARYENPVGFLGPGRAFYAGIKANF